MAAAVNARFAVLYDGVLHTRASSWLVFVTWPTQYAWPFSPLREAAAAFTNTSWWRPSLPYPL